LVTTALGTLLAIRTEIGHASPTSQSASTLFFPELWMAKTVADVMKMVKENEVKFVDFRFTDTRGKEQHVSVPVSHFDEDKFSSGHAFDGSSIAGWKGIEASDMLLMPDPNTANIDPFFEEPTLFLSCDVIEPGDGKAYERDPRSLAKRAEAYLKSSGLGDTAYFGPEPEFFIFDQVRWNVGMDGSFVKVDSEEASWSTGEKLEGGNMGHRPAVKGGYFPVPPVDSFQDMRSEMCLILENLGIPVEVHHHEVAGAGQNEIGTRFSTLVQRADWLQLQKYVIHNVAHAYGKTATFMPKPIVGDNGSGMHVHQSVWKDGKNLFAGDGYAGLSEFALHYIGGIIKHARALNAITNPGTNSYKRLVPGFEAPVKLAYSARNRSASIRIPYVANPKGRRIEARFPDPLCNPYLGFSAMLMAGLDGVENKIHPGEAATKDLYHLPPEEDAKIPTVCHSLDQALEYLDKGRAFLTKGGVFTDAYIDAYIELKMQEVTRFRMTTHPLEFDMYYSL
jgi:glutamine synthetase